MEMNAVQNDTVPVLRDTFRAGTSSVFRSVTVKPAMSGHNSLFVGQIGDWTWDAVSALCDTNVFSATNANGAPTYLAFYYFHIKSSPTLHLTSLTFGDRLETASTLFSCGSESILTLHRIRRESPGIHSTEPVDLEEFYEFPHKDCIYVETFNRWIARSRANTNQDLIRSSPVGFKYAHLDSLPDRYSPRQACTNARVQHTFHDPESPGFACVVEDFHAEYRVDITRDINGVGLVYFAAYFSIIDGAILKLWRHLGRSAQSFLDRIVLDHKLGYFGNAELDSMLHITLKMWRSTVDAALEAFNTVIRESTTGRVIAVSTIQISSEADA